MTDWMPDYDFSPDINPAEGWWESVPTSGVKFGDAPVDTWNIPTHSPPNSYIDMPPSLFFKAPAASVANFMTEKAYIEKNITEARNSGNFPLATQLTNQLNAMMQTSLADEVQMYLRGSGTGKEAAQFVLDKRIAMGTESGIRGPYEPMDATWNTGADKAQNMWLLPSYFLKPPTGQKPLSPMAQWAVAQLFPSVKPATITKTSPGRQRPDLRRYINESWQSPWETEGKNTPALKQYWNEEGAQNTVWYMPQVPSAQLYQTLLQEGALPYLDAYMKDIGGQNPQDYWDVVKQYWPTSSGERRQPIYRQLPQR